MRLVEWAHGLKESFKKVAKIYADHYVVFSSTIFIIFTGLCYLYTTNYYSNFGIDFYQFGSLSDVYQAAVTGGILSVSFILLLFVYTISSFVLRYRQEVDDGRDWAQIASLLCIFLMIASCALLTFGFFVTGPKKEVSDIKKGFAARYMLHTESGQFECLSIAASTSNYFVVWDGQLAEARIISRQSVVRFDLIVEPPPGRFLMLPRGRRPTEAQLNELIERQQRWSEKLKLKCGLTVDWPVGKPNERS